jgi:hypothetical protein
LEGERERERERERGRDKHGFTLSFPARAGRRSLNKTFQTLLRFQRLFFFFLFVLTMWSGKLKIRLFQEEPKKILKGKKVGLIESGTLL